MSFTNPRGTRGGRQPRGPLMRWMNTMMAKRVRKAGAKPMMGMNLLVLHTVGAKTGAARQVPLAWFPGPGESVHVVASANGAIGNPSWYHNLAAHPDQVAMERNGVKTVVTAQELTGEERAQAWAAISSSAGRWAGYETKTDRVIPVIRLTPRG